MDLLLAKLDDYEKLINCKLIYYLEDNTCIDVILEEKNFLHMVGLHKLTDIFIIQRWRINKNIDYNDVLYNIKTGKLTDKLIRNSRLFYLIEDRYDNFSYNNLTCLAYTDLIIDFDKCKIHSKLKGNYLLFDKDSNNEFNIMSIGFNTNTSRNYIETFFHEKTDKYIKGQKSIKIKKYQMLDFNNNLIFEDIY